MSDFRETARRAADPAPLGLRAGRTWTPPVAWAAAGVLLGLPFCANALEWLAPVSAVPLLLLARTTERRFLPLAWLGGTAFVATGLTWLHVVSPVAVLLLALYFGAYMGFAAFVAGPLGRRAGWPPWASAPLAILAAESLAQHVTVFDVTWLFQGYLLWRCTELLQAAEWGGISLLSALLWLVAGAAVHLRERRGRLRERSSWLPLPVALALAAALWGAGAARLGSLQLEPGPRVALVQGNVPMAIKLSPDAPAEMVRDHLELTLQQQGLDLDLVVWPETAAMMALEAQPAVVDAVQRAARRVGAPIVLGAFGLNPGADPPAPSNSAFLVTAEQGLAGRQDKRVLVPGAETLPVLRHLPPVRDSLSDLLSRTMGFRPHMIEGREAVPLQAGELRVGAMICYGDLVPVPAEELRRAGAEVLLTLSNEAWFGPRELDQHLAMAVVRSIETRLPMGRATNTGITCVIDPAGRVVEQLPRNQRGVLVAELPVTETAVLPWWLRRVPSALSLVLVAGLGVAARRRRGPAPESGESGEELSAEHGESPAR